MPNQQPINNTVPVMKCDPTPAQILQQFGRLEGPPIPVANSTGPSPTPDPSGTTNPNGSA